jgi:ABC-2 type transport system permease protein
MLTGSDALNGWGWLLAGAIISGGFLMHFFLDLSIGWLAFWIDDVWSFEHFKGITFGILAGVSFPFEFLPGNIQWLFNFLPFKFLYYTPISYVLGKRGLEELGGDLLSISLWAVGFSVLSWLLWRRGLRKYEAFGN